MKDQEKNSMIAHASNCASFLCNLSKDLAMGASPEKRDATYIDACHHFEALKMEYGTAEEPRISPPNQH